MTLEPISYSSFAGPLALTRNPLLRGDALFETVRVEEGTPLLLKRHLVRLSTSAKELEFDPFAAEEISLRAEELAEQWVERLGRMRITLLSDGEFFITIEELIDTSTFPVKLGVSPTTQYSQGTLSGMKSTSYGAYAVHQRNALAAGLSDLILLNERGEIVESSIANIFILAGEVILTPPRESGCLPGIARELLLEMTPQISERTLALDELFEATSIFLASSLRGISQATLLTHKGKVRNFQADERVTELAKLFSERQREESPRKR